MNTRFSTNRAADERALFEEAKAKLAEAFVLMRSLEGRLDAWDAVRLRGGADEEKRAEERAELLAYVEEAQREALRLARRSRRLSRVRVRARTPATVERDDATIDESAFDDIDESSVLAAERRPTEKHFELDPIERADQVERLLDEVAKAVAVGTDAVSALDQRGPFALAYPPPADGLNEGSAAHFATHAAAIYALAAERMEKGLAASPEPPSVETNAIAMKLVTMVDDADLIDIDDISDEELKAFEQAMVANAATAVVKWWPAASQSAESEKAGARMRRDRSPTEIMDRPPPTPLQRLKRFLTARVAVVVIASAVLGTLIGLTMRAIFDGGEDEVLTETLRLPFVGPPSELAPDPESLLPFESPESQTRTMREARPQSSAPAIKAAPKCATAKCRASSSGQAKKTKTAATAAAKVESKRALSSGLTGSLARRATTTATPTTPAIKSVMIAQGT